MLLSREGALRFNETALELLGRPKAIRLLFNVQHSRIGIRPEDPEVEYALPLRVEKEELRSSHQVFLYPVQYLP